MKEFFLIFKDFKTQNGAIGLPLILLASALITEIAVTLTLTSFLLTNSAADIKWSIGALSASQSGIEEGIMKVIRNKDFNGTSTISVGLATVSITITKDSPSTGKHTIMSLATIRQIQRKLEAVINVSSTTGQVEIQSIQEIAL